MIFDAIWLSQIMLLNTDLLSAILDHSLSKSARKSDNFGHLDSKYRSFQYSPRTTSNKKINQKLSFTHRGSYKVKVLNTYNIISV